MAIESRQLTAGHADRPTAAEVITELPSPPATAQLIPQVSALRIETGALHSDVVDLDRTIFDLNLRERTATFEHRSVQSLLRLLASDYGVGWGSMARMLGVSTPAIRKWRFGEGISPANRSAVARLAALMDMLSDHFMIEEPASWLEIPLAATRYSLVDLYAAGRLDLILEYAGRRITNAEDLLDQHDPNWRDAGSLREFEVFQAADGQPAVRKRTR